MCPSSTLTCMPRFRPIAVVIERAPTFLVEMSWSASSPPRHARLPRMIPSFGAAPLKSRCSPVSLVCYFCQPRIPLDILVDIWLRRTGIVSHRGLITDIRMVSDRTSHSSVLPVPKSHPSHSTLRKSCSIQHLLFSPPAPIIRSFLHIP